MARPVRNQMNPALLEHLHAKLHVAEVRLGLHLVHADERKLVYTAEHTYVLHEDGMERRNLRFSRTHIPLYDLMPDGVEKSRHVNAVGTSRSACVTAKAKPDALGIDYPVRIAQYGQPNKLMRKNIHLRSHRTTGRTLAALVTLVYDRSKIRGRNGYPTGRRRT